MSEERPMPTNDQLATLEVDGRVARLTLRRPEARNALSLPLLEALHARVDELTRMDEPSVCVLTGEGKCFCAGMDLKAVLDEPGAPRRLLGAIAELTIKARALPQVTIAQINGAAIGGGCGLACVCDLSWTHPEAKLGYPEVDIGVCPAVVAPWVVRKIGAGPARRLLLEGGTLSGVRAHELGLVDHLAESRDDLDELADAVVQRVASGGARALAATKGLLNELDGSLDEDLLTRGAALSAEVLATPEAQAALRARLEG